MALLRIKDATELEPGDRIVVQPGRVERVRASTTRDQHGGCTIRTDDHDILTGLPCAVKVEVR